MSDFFLAKSAGIAVKRTGQHPQSTLKNQSTTNQPKISAAKDWLAGRGGCGTLGRGL